MIRFLLFALIAAGVWMLLKRASKPTSRDASPNVRPQPTTPPTTPVNTVSDIVPCAHCGVHTPIAEALTRDTPSGREYYCCIEHRVQGPRTTR
jgi:uncharacterized protein